jgi:hypothetical protein
MSPSTKTAEQYERWHVRDCVRCGRRAAKAANWEGPICRTCYAKAVHTRGPCADCGADRLLPGRLDHARRSAETAPGSPATSSATVAGSKAICTPRGSAPAAPCPTNSTRHSTTAAAVSTRHSPS